MVVFWAGTAGIEPAAFRLTAGRSASWAINPYISSVELWNCRYGFQFQALLIIFMTLAFLRIRTALIAWRAIFLPLFFAVRVTICTGRFLNPWLCVMLQRFCCECPLFSPSRWIGFEPITTSSLTIWTAVKIPDRIYFSALYQIELPPASLSGWSCTICLSHIRKISSGRHLVSWKCRIRTASLRPWRSVLPLHHILHDNPNGNRTRTFGATVRRTNLYTIGLYYGFYCRWTDGCIQSSCHPIVSELTQAVICLVCAWLIAFAQIKNRLPFRTSGRISNISCDQSVYSRVCTNTPGSRYPLDPALKRHTLLSLSAFSAAGIMVPWRSFGRYVLRELNICICSIAFPFRTCGSIFSDFHFNTI